MNEETWSTVDTYVTGLLLPPDEALSSALATSDAGGLPPIQVSAPQGKLLHLLARLHGARRILEVGTLGGYSTIWLARALPAGGRLVTLELDPAHAATARRNLDAAGLAEQVDVRLGPALETLARLADEDAEPFDLVFVDADKPNNPGYLRWALRLTRPGGVIVVDNVVRRGAVADPDSTDPAVRGTRELFELVAAEPRLDATVIQTVGGKGYDGFLVALVTG